MSFLLPIAKWIAKSDTQHETAPRSKAQPTVEWQVNGLCNYDCTYCIQSRKSRVGYPDTATIDAIVGGLGTLPGVWEVKMSGGEVFAFKGFIDHVVPQMMHRTQHVISVLTNFSAPIHVLRRFSELTGSRLRITSASFHPDTAKLDEFLAKAIEYRECRESNNPNSSFVVNVVLVPGSVSHHFRYRDALNDAGLRYFPQLMKIRGGVYPYDDSEIAMIAEITGGSCNPREVNRAPNYQGLFCEAGMSYFIIDQKGEAYTCRTAKKYSGVDDAFAPDEDDDAVNGQDDFKVKARLGSFVRGDFQLFREGGLCPYSICPCTVPANRGIVHLPPHTKIPTEEEFDA